MCLLFVYSSFLLYLIKHLFYSLVGEQDSVVNREGNTSVFVDDEVDRDSEETISVENIG